MMSEWEENYIMKQSENGEYGKKPIPTDIILMV